ncbi:MAG: tetratricopeptide repeat protein, partial [Bacteroidetes bacterium]|nr:tetratricopeptide repeat protein [Bacteroidota bacterium]
MNRLMRFFIGIVLVLTVQSVCFAHSASLPSSAKTKPEKIIDSLNDIPLRIYLESPDSARAIAEKALLLAEKAKYKLGIGRSFMNIGHVYWSQSYNIIALFCLDKALMELPKNQQRLICDAYNIEGRIYADLGDYNKALQSLKKAENLAKGDPDCIAETYGERSLVYKRTGKYDEAIKYAYKSLSMDRMAGDKADEAIIYGRLSGIY